MNILNFNDTLTNDIVSFEQPGPGFFDYYRGFQLLKQFW